MNKMSCEINTIHAPERERKEVRLHCINDHAYGKEIDVFIWQ